MSAVPRALDSTGAQRLQAYLDAHIPLLRNMQLRVDRWDASGLTVSAPLAANRNHKGTAFGGSLESLAMLACWGTLWLLLEDQPGAQIVVTKSRMQFLRPVHARLIASCVLPADTTWQHFLAVLHRRHKARIELHARVLQMDQVCAEFTGQFATLRGRSHAAA